MKKGKFFNRRQLPAAETTREEVIPVRVPPEMAGKKEKTPKYKGNKIITRLFYGFYFLLIISFCLGMYFVHGKLVDWLEAYEAAQPYVKSEAVFQEYFADPDWGSLYEMAGLADTPYEGKDTFIAYMDSLVSGETLTYAETSAELSGDRKYLLQLKEQTLGHFILSNYANPEDSIPDWQLNEVAIYLTRKESVTIEKQDGCTAYVNGQPVNDDCTVEIRSSLAETYLPDGALGIRRLRQEVSDLLMVPTVTILDENGDECPTEYNPETGIYTQLSEEPQPIPQELEARAIAAGEAFCYYMVNRNTHLFGQYFAAGTTTYRNITGMDRWQQTSKEAAITGQSVSDYTRYTDDLFSVRVTMTTELTRMNDTIKRYPLDATLFLENRKAGWMVISMTYVDVTLETSQVRLRFMSGDQQLSTAFYDSLSTEIYAPLITAPQGQVFSGWAEKKVAPDGTTTMHLRFTPDENGIIRIPQDMDLTPMTLYAVFEYEASESEVTQ